VLVATVVTAFALGLEPYARRPRVDGRKPVVEETTAAVEAPPRARAAGTHG
jgi:hypothetical protein